MEVILVCRQHLLGLSDLEYAFSRLTKSSNSTCRSSRVSSLLFNKSGLYLDRNSSSVGVSHIVKAGPPTATAMPLHQVVSFGFAKIPILRLAYPRITLLHSFQLVGFFAAIFEKCGR